MHSPVNGGGEDALSAEDADSAADSDVDGLATAACAISGAIGGGLVCVGADIRVLRGILGLECARLSLIASILASNAAVLNPPGGAVGVCSVTRLMAASTHATNNELLSRSPGWLSTTA